MAQKRYYASTAKQASLSTAIDSVVTSITLDLITGFPSQYPYTLVIDPDTNKEEIITVTSSGGGTTLNVIRGEDGTNHVSHGAGATVRHAVSGRDFNDAAAHIGSDAVPTTSGVHGVTGNVVGTTDAQDVSNKRFIDTKSLDFDTVSPDAAGVGKMVWNDTYGTLEYQLKGGNVTLQMGQETVARVVNKEGSTIADGSVVYISGAQGNLPAVKLAQANAESTSSKTFGVATEDIANNNQGYVTLQGMIHGLNTSALTEGANIWLSPSVPGGLTTTKPVAPNHGVWIGICVRQHASVGQIYVSPRNGYELDELHDVLITSPATGHILTYDASTGLWVNSGTLKSDLSAGGFKVTNLGTPTSSGDATPKGYIDTLYGTTASAAASATAAAASAAAAATSASSAAVSASSAQTSATSAANSQASVTGLIGAGIVRDLGLITETDTTSSTMVNIQTVADAAAASAASAGASASAASTSASSAAVSASSASTSASAAAASAATASTSAAQAATSATAAATSANSASTSATAAAGSQAAASTSAASAATSATSASTSATSAAASATTASASAATATTSAAQAATSANSAATSATSAATSASSAATSATSAAASAAAAAAYVPSMTGNAGKYLTTDGSVASWATVNALPSQTGNAGKYLTTDGSTASWATIVTDPLPQIMMMMGA